MICTKMSMPSKEIKYTDAIFQATNHALETREDVFVIGLGVSYANGADGTMGDLGIRFPSRVLDVPVSEAAITGAALGSAISGMRPIVHHGRVEFALFAADQIFTQAAKWNYMFGGNYPAPIVFRIALGRQWGNGPQHTQALYGLFGGVPGLKVVIPSTPYMAKGLLISAIADNNPVVFLEPRWLYQIKEKVPADSFELPLNKARVVNTGESVTLATYGDGVIDALKASKILSSFGINLEVIDLVSINPIDFDTIAKSVQKTKNIITLDTTNYSFNIGSMIISEIACKYFDILERNPLKISAPDVPVPTSTVLTELYYPNFSTVTDQVLKYFDLEPLAIKLSFEELHLPPSHRIDF